MGTGLGLTTSDSTARGSNVIIRVIIGALVEVLVPFPRSVQHIARPSAIEASRWQLDSGIRHNLR